MELLLSFITPPVQDGLNGSRRGKKKYELLTSDGYLVHLDQHFSMNSNCELCGTSGGVHWLPLPGSETCNATSSSQVWWAELQVTLFASSKKPSCLPIASYQCL